MNEAQLEMIAGEDAAVRRERERLESVIQGLEEAIEKVFKM